MVTSVLPDASSGSREVLVDRILNVRLRFAGGKDGGGLKIVSSSLEVEVPNSAVSEGAGKPEPLHRSIEPDRASVWHTESPVRFAVLRALVSHKIKGLSASGPASLVGAVLLEGKAAAPMKDFLAKRQPWVREAFGIWRSKTNDRVSLARIYNHTKAKSIDDRVLVSNYQFDSQNIAIEWDGAVVEYREDLERLDLLLEARRSGQEVSEGIPFHAAAGEEVDEPPPTLVSGQAGSPAFEKRIPAVKTLK